VTVARVWNSLPASVTAAYSWVHGNLLALPRRMFCLASICLSVYLIATSCKSYSSDLRDNFTINFGRHLQEDREDAELKNFNSTTCSAALFIVYNLQATPVAAVACYNLEQLICHVTSHNK